MTPTGELPPLQAELRRSQRVAKSTEKAKGAAVKALPEAEKPPPPPKEYVMDQTIDDEIRGRCW